MNDRLKFRYYNTKYNEIDGVDVSGCKHYKHNDKNSGWSGCASKDEEHIHSVNPLCCEKKDCLYKQLKRKEQECERLRNEIRLYNCIEKWGTKECHCACRCLGNEFCNDADKKINQLKAENDELKEQLTILDEEDMVVEITVKQFEEYKKLKQTLQEIKEIAEENYYYLDCDYRWILEKILQKISECEVE